MKDIIILAIESSCDETAAAVVKNGREILSNIISTQIEIHKKFGGVVPEVASRHHIENITIVIDQALEKAKVTYEEIDAIAVTYGPGLVGALLIGLTTAKSIAYAKKIPLIGVNHIEGHICANYMAHKELQPPFVCLVASGGHSHMVHVIDYGKYEVMGRTRDDAAGEAFDKVSRAIGLGYPGGALIDQLAKEGNPTAIPFPKALLEGTYDFSFSGIKSAVLNYINSSKMKQIEINKADLAASFQEVVVDVLSTKLVLAGKEKQSQYVTLAGGVAANTRLRAMLTEKAEKAGLKVAYPPMILCTDNAVMIGCAAYYQFMNNNFSDYTLNAAPNLTIQ